MTNLQESPKASTVDQSTFAALCAADGEFILAAKGWTGGLRIDIGEAAVGVTVDDGDVSAVIPVAGSGVIALSASDEVWQPVLAAIPAPLKNCAYPLISRGQIEVEADGLTMWQYMPALDRAIELLRPVDESRPVVVDESGATPRHDSPVGRYVHLSLGDVDHRVYYEEAGQGIPLLCQHTAGANGLQYRHLFEMSEITDHFRVIAYDLPFHGKSIPPVDTRWWESEYALKGEFLRSVPVQLAAALELDQPVFMGCSVGGLLALDLAYHHPDVFRAVVSLEGALRIGGDWNAMAGMHHPQVSNMAKARMMEGLCSPTSPEPYVKEVSQVYSAGWPAAFRGDLYYYMVDYDLREVAGDIDTARCGVHIMNGEYDWSGTVEHGRSAHEAIAGSTHTVMTDVGHFPMQENPTAFAEYLLPVLDSIRT